MRLINTRTLKLHEFFDADIPRYIILSHRWEADEVSYQDWCNRSKPQSQGSLKVTQFCCIVKEAYDCSWAWVDTCCIDKTSSAELSEAINSMYRWYEKSVRCITYMSDVTGMDDFAQSKWFTRGWTLQELLAPSEVVFYNTHWYPLGTRNDLSHLIHETTGIDQNVLITTPSSIFERHGELTRRENIQRSSVAKKMSWAASRQTSRTEDVAYCLFGLFGINMPLIYGEGRKAFQRLQREIIKDLDDESVFAWHFHHDVNLHSPITLATGFLASSPQQYSTCGKITRLSRRDIESKCLGTKPFFVTNKGLQFHARLLRFPGDDRHKIRYIFIPFDFAFNDTTPSTPVSLGPKLPLVLPAVRNQTNDRYYRLRGPIDLTPRQWAKLLRVPGRQIKSSLSVDSLKARLGRVTAEEVYLDLDSTTSAESWHTADYLEAVAAGVSESYTEWSSHSRDILRLQ